MVFSVCDLAGNTAALGPFAILVDSTSAVAISTPASPLNGAYVAAAQPSFYWIGPSTTVAAGLQSPASYYLQVSRNDASFGAANIVISISTPVVTSPGDLTANALYVSTTALSDATPYYWRVRVQTKLGVASPWSQAYSFITQFPRRR